MWVNRSARRIQQAAAEADQWFARFAEPFVLRDLLPTTEGCTVHVVAKNTIVSFDKILASLTSGKITRTVLQDPYLLTQHQMKCLADFLAAVPWPGSGEKVPFRLLTHLSDADPRDRDQLTAMRQQQEITRCLSRPGCLDCKVEYRYRKYAPLHMRYAHFILDGTSERLFMFERGLDMEDMRTGKARGETYVLEFRQVPESLKGILAL